METREFLDLIYQHWAKTTGSSDCFWMPEEAEGDYPPMFKHFLLFAVDERQQKKQIASQFKSEADVDFITAIHGCLPDLVRQCHEALDEADAKDLLADEYINRVGSLEMEIMELKEIIRDLEGGK